MSDEVSYAHESRALPLTLPDHSGQQPSKIPSAITRLPHEILEMILVHLPLESRLLSMQTCHVIQLHGRQSNKLWNRITLPRSAITSHLILQPTALCTQLINQCLVYAGSTVQEWIAASTDTCLTDSLLCRMIYWMPNLVFLDLSSSGIGKQGLNYLFHGDRTNRIQRLVLANIKALTDETLAFMGRALPSLRSLDISSNSSGCQFSDQGIQALINAQAGIKLEEIIAKGCPSLTDVAVEAISRMCPQLKVIDISGSFEISDFGVRCLLKNNILLNRLNLSFCWRITDEAFLDCGKAISTRSPPGSPSSTSLMPLPEELILRSSIVRSIDIDSDRVASTTPTIASTLILGGKLSDIDLTFCYQLDDRGVGYLAELPSLKHIKLSHCSGITHQSAILLSSRGVDAEFEGSKWETLQNFHPNYYFHH